MGQTPQDGWVLATSAVRVRVVLRSNLVDVVRVFGIILILFYEYSYVRVSHLPTSLFSVSSPTEYLRSPEARAEYE